MLDASDATVQRRPPATLPDLVELQARRTPDAPAVECDGTVLSYAELSARATRLAGALAARGVGPEGVVAIAVPRSVDLVVGLLGIVRAGAAYLPLDPDYPADRIAHMVDVARPAWTLEPAQVAEWSRDQGGNRQGTAVPIRSPHPDQPAYVMFTSGTTNRPKGVVVTHRAIGTRLAALEPHYRLRAGDRVLQKTPSGFDPSVVEVFGTLAAGATLVLARPGGHRDPAYLARLVRTERITMIRFVASMLPLFLDTYAAGGADGPLRLVVSEGEGLPIAVADRFRAALDVPLFNEYGPTEAAVGVTCLQCGPVDGNGVMPIGRATPGTGIRLLDAALRPVPAGIEGEVYLTGPQLARGYLGRPAETSLRFVADPLGPPGERMYRTGDLARQRPDGDLDFAGRVDDQVKIRGFRIELAEVTGAVAAHPLVTRAAVVVRRGATGDPALVAYAVPGERAPTLTELREHCARTLPTHMVPADLVLLDALPLTPNGKLDPRALPAPQRSRSPVGGPPRTPQERLLCTLYAEVLGVRPVGVDDDFIALGGHSLAAARLVGRLRAVAGVELPLSAVLATPTVALLARELVAATAARPGPVPVPRPARPALSFAQQRIWFVQQREGAGATYAVPTARRLRGPLDRPALASALTDVVARHESLRTVFPVHEGVPYQRVLAVADAAVDLPVTGCAEGELDGVLRALASTPFDLAAELPIRAHLVAVGPADHVLLVVIHHIATDGWSERPLWRDLAQAYAARTAGRIPDQPPLPVQYHDYACWQRDLLGAEDDPGSLLSRQLGFWTRTLAGLPEETTLPVDRPHRAAGSRAGGAVAVDLDAPTHRRLLDVAQESGATLFMALHAALAALLSRLGAGRDVPIGGMVAGRDDESLTELVGMFANTVVLRTDVSGAPTFRELLGRVRAADIAVHAHRELPFERLVEELRPARTGSRHPLFQTLLVLQPDPGPAPGFPLLSCADHAVDTGTAKVDLTLDVTETHDRHGDPAGLHGTLRYAADLFDRSTARTLADRLRRVLHAVAQHPDRPVDAVDVLLPGELPVRDAAGEAVARDATVHGLVERRAASRPRGPALVFDDGGTVERVDRGSLEERANRLSHHLVAAGVRRGDVVGVYVERGPRLVVSLLAVLKAGAAYTVLDVAFPPVRLESVLHLAGVRTVVSTAAWAGRLRLDGRRCVDLDAEAADVAARPATPPGVPAGAADSACVIFTSGSTGVPKAVLVPHRALVGSLHRQRYSGFGPGEAVLQCAPVSWDAFARQLFGPLIGGGTCVLQPGQRPEPAVLARLAVRHGVTVLDTAGSLFAHLWDEHPETFPGLRWALTGGEPASAAHLATVLDRHPGLRVVNGYGPVESTGFSTAFRADGGWRTPTVPIGEPVPGKTARLLDDRLRPVPRGVPGELYLGGVGLAHGYAGHPGLTAERFVADPYGRPGERIYRTGDLARYGADGLLEYLGRSDDQVKIRGFRVEPEETRSALVAHPAVRQAAVVVREDRPGDPRLVAYVVPAAAGTVDGEQLRAHARERLPEHLVPAAVVPLPALPLTPNGKLDKRALPVPEVAASSGRAPRTPLEQAVCGLFAELLGLPSVSADDDFFRLGGHSLLVMRLLGRIRRELHAELSIAAVFDGPTAAALADRLVLAKPARPALRARTRETETL